MFEKFTDRAKRVLVLAQEAARTLKHNYIGTEHILLGLIREGEGVAVVALESLDIGLEAVRQQVETIIGEGQQASPEYIPFTPRARAALELTLRESLQLSHNYIGTEHILLGLILEGEGVAAQVLLSFGADLNRVREQVIHLLAPQASGVRDQMTSSGIRLSEAATAALRLAATRMPPNGSLTTGRVLAALSRADSANDWQRLWSHTGDPEDLCLADAADTPDLVSSSSWEDVPLSTRMAAALSRLTQLCHGHALASASTGLLALAIVADPDSGAARTLIQAGLPHAELLEILQADLVGSHLSGLAGVIPPQSQLDGAAESASPDFGPALLRQAGLRAERFTARARRVVVLAQEEARMLNHNYIGTEHILLGLIHEGEGVAAKALVASKIRCK